MQRPEQQLIATKRSYPDVNKMIDDFRQSKGKDLPNWASFCFMPMAGWYAITCQMLGKYQLALDDMPIMQQIAAVGTWQFSKGIYQFDDALYQALITSKIEGKIPSDVLHRLPEWCMYVETPSLNFMKNLTYGFYVWLEHDMNTNRHELRLLIDCEYKLISVPLHLGEWSIYESVERYLKEANLQSSLAGYGLLNPLQDDIDSITHDIIPFLSLILYICSDEPDLSNLEEPNTHPQRPQPKKTKKGWRLFPAEKIKTWSVGQKIGKQLRQTLDEFANTDRKVKAHLRRGYHKTYWTGKRGTDEQKPISHWIPPAIVGGNKED